MNRSVNRSMNRVTLTKSLPELTEGSGDDEEDDSSSNI